jgi:hypothetical protein
MIYKYIYMDDSVYQTIILISSFMSMIVSIATGVIFKNHSNKMKSNH